MNLRNVVGTVISAPFSRKLARGATQPHHAPENEPLLPQHESEPSSHTSNAQRYGSVEREGESSGWSSRRASPEAHRRDSTLNRVPEEDIQENLLVEELDLDEQGFDSDLEDQGLYFGSYRKVVAMYTFVPLSSVGLLLFLAFCPSLFWSSRTDQPHKHPSYFPSPVPELILSASLWSFAYLLRIPLYASVSFLLQKSPPIFSVLSFNAVYVVVYNFLRLSSLPILHVREGIQRDRPLWHDGVFQRVWWLALGWATIDVTVGIVQSYSQIALYRNVMVPEEHVAEVLADGSGIESHTPHLVTASHEILPLSPRHEGPKAGSESLRSLDEAIRLAVDQDLEQLMNLKEREDVEEVYGVPVIKIPVFVSCLQRVDSILLSVGITLILSASYLHSAISKSVGDPASPDMLSSNNKLFLVAFPLVLLLNLFLNILHTPLVLPRIGVHTAAYISFLLGLGSLFIGLGLWGALA